MSMRTMLLDWSLDGPVGLESLLLVVAVGLVYLLAASRGRKMDRRGRRWPRDRTACFIAGLALLLFDVYSGIGTEADSSLSVHMVEHMILWVVVAPLLCAGAPVRLALYALPREARRRIGRCLRSPVVSTLTGSVGSVILFSGVVLLSYLPAVYSLALRNDYVHEAEHGLYLLAAVLLWAPLIGADPLPHRPGPRGQVACMAACMVPMVMVAVWLRSAPQPVYAHYFLAAPKTAAVNDQRTAGTIMLIAGLPAFAVPAFVQLRPRIRARRAPAGPVAAGASDTT